jgi:hypothetical protein
MIKLKRKIKLTKESKTKKNIKRMRNKFEKNKKPRLWIPR